MGATHVGDLSAARRREGTRAATAEAWFLHKLEDHTFTALHIDEDWDTPRFAGLVRIIAVKAGWDYERREPYVERADALQRTSSDSMSTEEKRTKLVDLVRELLDDIGHANANKVDGISYPNTHEVEDRSAPTISVIALVALKIVAIENASGGGLIDFGHSFGPQWEFINTVVAMGVAITKASLVVLIFMGVRYNTPLTKVVVVSGFKHIIT